jgi:predicted MFS family arabinose efflux permease
VTVILAVATGVAVANVYYIQPVLALMAADLHVSSRAMGTLAMMMQIGYALGIVVFVPLGDIVARRALIVGMFGLTALFLIGVAVAPTFGLIGLAILLVGVTTTAPQVLMPFAADLATAAQRGSVVGVIQTGLVIGTIGARAIGGLLGAHLGWRAVFAFAAVVAALATIVLARVLPVRPPTVALRYAQTMRSLPGFVARYAVLRLSMGLGFISFGSVAGLWTVLAFHARTIGYGADVVGELGLVSVLGAIVAGASGALGDRRGTLFTGTLGWLLTLGSLLVLLAGGDSIWWVAGAAASLAMGTQLTQVANQARIFALDGSARSRINTVYMFTSYAGGATGALLAAWSYAAGGWTLFCVTMAGAVAAMGPFLLWYRGIVAPGGVRFAPGAKSS